MLLCNRGHALLQDLALRRLGVSKVHHLIHQLINNDKVVSDRFLLELLEVFYEDLHEAVQEEDDLGGVGVPL